MYIKRGRGRIIIRRRMYNCRGVFVRVKPVARHLSSSSFLNARFSSHEGERKEKEKEEERIIEGRI